MARQKRPTVPKQVSAYVVDSYVRLRKQHKDQESANKAHTYTSARTLLGILRLAQALARIRFSDTVEHPDVDEALRLMEKSKESLEDEGDRDREGDQSDTTKIYRIIKDMASISGSRGGKGPRRSRRFGKGPGGERDMQLDSDDDDDDDDGSGLSELSMVDVRARVLAAGFTETQLLDTITEVSV
jgi:DNA replication licensing factor MCM7